MKKLLVLTLLALPIYSVSALSILPEGSFWEGYKLINERGMSGGVEYAVYDKQSTDFQSSAAAADFANIGTGQYVYAYQIFTTSAEGYTAIASFNIPGLNTALLSGLDSIDDGQEGIDGDNDGVNPLWRFEDKLVNGAHTYFLVFSANSGPVAGTYEVEPYEGDDFPVPDNAEVPEPATMIMLALGCLPALIKRKRA